MTNSFKNAINSGHGNALLYAGALGLLVSDIIPTPADAVYFRVMEKNKQKLDRGEITPKQYWTREAVFYYGLNPLWWALFLSALYYTKGDYNSKVKVGLALLAGGAVIGVLNKNIKEEQNVIKKY